MGKYRSYRPGTVLNSGRTQTLDGYIANKVYEWYYKSWVAENQQEKAVDFSASEIPETAGHALAAAASQALHRRAAAYAPNEGGSGDLNGLLSLRLWFLNRHAPTGTVPAAYGAIQLWPQVDWHSMPAKELVAFCQGKWPHALESLDVEHQQAESIWSELNERFDAQVQERWGSATERKESLIRRGRYLVKSIFCPITNTRANARLDLPADHYKTRERYYDLLDAWTKQGGEDQEIDGLLALPLPRRRWVQRKGGRDFDPEQDTIDAWLRVEVSAKVREA